MVLISVNAVLRLLKRSIRQGQNALGSLSLSTGLTPSHNRAERDCGSCLLLSGKRKNVLIFAVLQLWLIQLWIDCAQFFLNIIFAVLVTFERDNEKISFDKLTAQASSEYVGRRVSGELLHYSNE